MTLRRNSPDSERGSVLIYTAIALVALMGFTAFVVDLGVLWAARRQAQNSADAAALAGAIAMMSDPDTSDTGMAKTTAHSVTQVNRVWGGAPTNTVATDVTFPGPGFSPDCVAGPPPTCIRVDVYRSGGNALPMLFGPILGMNNQSMRAMAVARSAAANAAKCMKPFAIADKWQENYPVAKPWGFGDTYQPLNGDKYIPQNGTTDAGSGFKLPDDYGVQMTLKEGDPHDTINPGWYQAVDLDGGGGGGSEYRSAISGCIATIYGIGDDMPKKNGNMTGPTKQGIDDLVALDPDAEWDPSANGGKGGIVGSCVTGGGCPGGAKYSESPRIVAIPVFNLDYYMQTGGPGNGTVRIVNILGFFVEGLSGGKDVVGRLVTKPDLFVGSKGTVAGPASFVKTTMLIR